MSSDYQPTGTGVVIKADGTVPFDEDCHPLVKGEICAWLTAIGHTFTAHPEGHLQIHDYNAVDHCAKVQAAGGFAAIVE